MKTVFRILIVIALVLFGLDYIRVRSDAICAHNSIVQHSAGK
jgi:hypothetical protein